MLFCIKHENTSTKTTMICQNIKRTGPEHVKQTEEKGDAKHCEINSEMTRDV